MKRNPKIREIKIRLKKYGDVTVRPENVLTGNIDMQERYGIHFYVIGHEFGALVAVWSYGDQDALDDAVDAGKMDAFMVSDEDFRDMNEREREELAYLGNASEPFDLTNAWMERVDLKLQSPALIKALTKAQELDLDNLGELK
jgi:hypothetical protein